MVKRLNRVNDPASNAPRPFRRQSETYCTETEKFFHLKKEGDRHEVGNRFTCVAQ
ncbi:hypothetical protein D3C84_1287580 [compost metagenome]